MRYDEFIDRVQKRANFDDRQNAETITAVVLATLAEPLSRESTNLLASQLPKELKDLLGTHRETPLEGMKRYSLEEFHNRVKSRLSTTFQQGASLVRAVTTVLPEAVTVEVMERIKQDLPAEYAQLFA